MGPQILEDWFINRPELGQGYLGVMPSEIVPEEGGVVCLPPLTLGHIRAFIIEWARLPHLSARVSPSRGCASEVSMAVSWRPSPWAVACGATEEEEEGVAGAHACLPPSEGVVV